ncbi:hypothetical protein SAMN04488109_5952 [Chryseolinea serpens]|uniref:Uncharacterized protein n=1 Tax=Chryseolinea serpens TaxID=947013 RepID=A0A1M5WRR0_9BACT|nr:hypothetical protein [Chryseolinea serpens]SHH90257.1 hypothetical protein SAMN04488109_5952 [Chryseolinea serpens]
MTTLSKKDKEQLDPETRQRLEKFISQLKAGEIEPFKEQTERARENLRKAGLIK